MERKGGYSYQIEKIVTMEDLEIDYQRLQSVITQAIKDADKKELSHDDKASTGEHIGFKKAIWSIIGGTNKTDGNLTAKLFSSILSVFFTVLAVLSAATAIACLLVIPQIVKGLLWSGETIASNMLVLFLLIIVILLLVVIGLMLRGAANELETETDRNYIVSVFSGIVSFVALIVALVALFEEVG